MPNNFIKKIKNNENYCRMHLINFIHRCINEECIPIRETVKKHSFSAETKKAYEQQTNAFTEHLIKEWGIMLFNTPEHKLYPRNARAKEQLIKLGKSLNDILINPNIIFDYLNEDSAPVIKNQNGCYIYPYILKNQEKIGHHLGRFYISLAPDNICAFMNILMEKLPDGQFSFKFFSCEKADRVVIYPHSQALFKICEAITFIRKEHPELFANADNKWFTTSLVEGVSYASDLNFTFSEATYHLMESYIYDGLHASVNFNAPQIRNKSKLILQSLYKTKYQNKIEFTKNNPSHPYALKTILTETEFVNQNIDNLLNCLKEHKTIMQIGNSSQNLFLDNQNLINAYKTLIGDNLKNTISKLIDYDNLKLYIQHSYAPQKYATPSPTNIAFSDEDIKLLSSLYDIYKSDDQWEQ